MEGKKLFDYDKEDANDKNVDSGTKVRDIAVKAIQIIVSIIMAILHL